MGLAFMYSHGDLPHALLGSVHTLLTHLTAMRKHWKSFTGQMCVELHKTFDTLFVISRLRSQWIIYFLVFFDTLESSENVWITTCYKIFDLFKIASLGTHPSGSRGPGFLVPGRSPPKVPMVQPTCLE